MMCSRDRQSAGHKSGLEGACLGGAEASPVWDYAELGAEILGRRF